jgi:DnaJ-class molecular chaperone
MAKDFYEALGVEEKASADEIKKTFRRLAKKYHPDRNPGNKQAEAKFKELSEAYETLSDEKKRAEYDQLRKYGAFSGAGGGGFNPNNFSGGPGGDASSGFDFNQFVNRRSANGQGFSSFSAGFDLNEILAAMMGQAGGSRMRGNPFGGFAQEQPQKGADLLSEISVSFMEAVKGGERLVQLSNGRKLKVKIPAGIADGGKIRLAGQGQPNPIGGPNGDLIVKVNVMPDQKFERKGNDIYSKVEISFKEAILGTKAEIDTLTKKLKLSIPAGTQPGTVMRLKGQGLGGGDQFVEIRVKIPTSLTEKQREILEGWE